MRRLANTMDIRIHRDGKTLLGRWQFLSGIGSLDNVTGPGEHLQIYIYNEYIETHLNNRMMINWPRDKKTEKQWPEYNRFTVLFDGQEWTFEYREVSDAPA